MTWVDGEWCGCGDVGARGAGGAELTEDFRNFHRHRVVLSYDAQREMMSEVALVSASFLIA